MNNTMFPIISYNFGRRVASAGGSRCFWPAARSKPLRRNKRPTARAYGFRALSYTKNGSAAPALRAGTTLPLIYEKLKYKIGGGLCLASESVCQRAAVHRKVLSCDIFCAIAQQEFCHFA